MKKASIILPVCLLLSAQCVHATSTASKYKDAALPAKTTETATPTPTWLDNVSGSMALTSNYVFRGISLSENNPAGLTYTFPVGVYFNVWGSNAKYSAPDGKPVSSEFDTIAGYQGTIIDDFSCNINLARYNYPGARAANYNELNTLWIYKILTLGLSYTTNYSGTHASGTYYSGALSYDIPQQYILNISDVSVAAGMGHYSLAKLAGNSYNDYILTINKKISDKYAIALQGTGTNGHAKQPPFDGNQIIGTVTATF
jgi:uncharacterized protein (TIGR02001 family)